MFISRREFYLDLKYEGFDEFFKEVKSSIVVDKNIAENCAVDVYKDHFPTCVAIEIKGPEEQLIKDLDLKMYSKIIEICERKGIENHECKFLGIL